MWIPSEPLVFGKRLELEQLERLLDRAARPGSSPRSRRRARDRGRRAPSRAATGLSTREYHVFMSMQPMFTIQSSASSSFTSGKSISRRCGGRSRVDASNCTRRDPVGHVLRRVLLEEELALPAVGVALHRERPVAQVRDEHRRDVAVVGEQVALRDPLLRPERLVQVRELEHPAALPDLGADRFRARAARPRPPCPRAAPGRRAPAAARRASTRRSATSATSFGSTQTTSLLADPRHLRRLAKGDVVPHERPQLVEQPVDLASSKPVPTLPAQRSPPAVVDAEHERAEAVRAAPLALRVAGDDELLPALRLDLQPVAAAPARAGSASRPLGR